MKTEGERFVKTGGGDANDRERWREPSPEETTPFVFLGPDAQLLQGACRPGAKDVQTNRLDPRQTNKHTRPKWIAYHHGRESESPDAPSRQPKPTRKSTRPPPMSAAARGKHMLLDKPTALCAADLDAILAACMKDAPLSLSCIDDRRDYME